MSGAVTSNDESSRRFMAAVATSTGVQQRSASAAGAAPESAPNPAPAPAAPKGAQSFPLSDPQPGQEPK